LVSMLLVDLMVLMQVMFRLFTTPGMILNQFL